MSLSLSLSNALTGLQLNQQALSTLSHNIANANTVGYSRQVVNQEAQYIDGIGVGVRRDGEETVRSAVAPAPDLRTVLGRGAEQGQAGVREPRRPLRRAVERRFESPGRCEGPEE